MHCDVPPVLIVVGLQFTETDEIVDGEVGEVGELGVPVEAIRTVAEPVRLGVCVLAAVTVTLPPVAGAVKTPVEEMEPALVVQVTDEL